MSWLGVIVFPLLTALTLPFARTEPLGSRVLVPLAAVPALALAVTLEADAAAQFDWLLFGTRFGFGEIGRVMLFLTALLWTLAGIYASSYLAEDPRRKRFFVFFALAMSGNLGLVAAQDVAAFYMFFSLMTFSAYGLVVHNGDAEAYRAGRVYLVAAIVGEVLLLAGILLAVWEADSLYFVELRAGIATSPLQDTITWLAFIGFGVKAGAAFVHFWLPLAHPVAPVPASAVLSGAMIKAGLIGWIHFLPFGIGADPYWGSILLAAGYVAAFGAAALGLAQREPKTVLAYSSVSQMGVITAALGIALLGAEMWPLVLPAVAVFALNHALAKGALFLGVGVAARAQPGSMRTVAMIGLAVAALAIAGAPYTGGAIAKHAAKYATTGLEAEVYARLPLLMSLSSIATTLLLAHFVGLIRRAEVDHDKGGVPAGLFVPWMALVVCVAVAVPWSIRWFALDIDPDDDFWTAAGPVAIGVVVYAAGGWLLRGRTLRIPAGDVVVPLEWLARRLVALLAKLRLRDPGAWQMNFVRYIEALSATESRRDFSRRLELRFRRWENAMIAFAAVLLAVVAALTLGGAA